MQVTNNQNEIIQHAHACITHSGILFCMYENNCNNQIETMTHTCITQWNSLLYMHGSLTVEFCFVHACITNGDSVPYIHLTIKMNYDQYTHVTVYYLITVDFCFVHPFITHTGVLFAKTSVYDRLEHWLTEISWGVGIVWRRSSRLVAVSRTPLAIT